MVRSNDLADAILDVIENYARASAEVMFQIAKEVAKDGTKMLKNTSPRSPGNGNKRGHYADGWAVKAVRTEPYNFSFVIHNKKKPGLTHLLEKGHQLRGGGRTAAFPHIAKVEQWCIEEYERRVREEL